MQLKLSTDYAIRIVMHLLVVPMHWAVGRPIAGAEAVCFQTAVDAGGALDEIDDLVEGNVLRPAA